MKVYVPKGTILEEVKGLSTTDVQIRYDQELDKTYFYAEMVTEPGEISEVTFIYHLPFKLEFNPVATYQLMVQKQPGIEVIPFKKKVVADYRLANYKNYPEQHILDDRTVEFEVNMREDRDFVSIWAIK